MIEIVVIGGGAAGMMAAITAARQGGQVTLLEPNERLGKKLNITGKGRCNVTNDCDQETLMANIPGNGRFLYSALTRFTPQDAMAFFEGLGVPLKVERGNRVFPVSDRSFDISGALERELRRLHVRWVRDRAREITVQDGHVTGVQGEKQHYPASAVMLATGGVSYPATGSTGDGYAMAAALGHTIVPPRGSLVPLESGDPDCAAMQGLSLRNVEATVLNDRNKPVFREFGEMLFTHFGVSGPLMLSASAHLRRWDKEQYRLVIDLKPALDEQKLDTRILRDIGENPKNLTFTEVEAATIPSIASEVDLAVINSNYALGAGLNPVEDALALESSDSPYVNVLVCKEGNENNAAIQALAEALHSDAVKNYIAENFDGAVIAVD